jgi:predicted HTH transcriptional regulator
MYWNGYIEKVGTGTEDIISKCKDYGLKTPEFHQEEDFRVVIWRTNENESDPKRSKADPKPIQSNLIDEEKLLELINNKPSISRAELSKQLKISERQVRKTIDKLRENGILIREGGNSGKWIISKNK